MFFLVVVFKPFKNVKIPLRSLNFVQGPWFADPRLHCPQESVMNCTLGRSPHHDSSEEALPLMLKLTLQVFFVCFLFKALSSQCLSGDAAANSMLSQVQGNAEGAWVFLFHHFLENSSETFAGTPSRSRIDVENFFLNACRQDVISHSFPPTNPVRWAYLPAAVWICERLKNTLFPPNLEFQP